YLHTVQNVMCQITKAAYRRLDHLLSRVVLDGKSSRLKLDILKLPLDEGGLGLPDLYLYFAATQLQHAVAWFGKRAPAGSCGVHSLQELFLMGEGVPRDYPYLVWQLVAMWHKVVCKITLWVPFADSLPIWYLRPCVALQKAMSYAR
ncbi:hypothetical protein NDU88_004790, partial [Pleurodeles waltl]